MRHLTWRAPLVRTPKKSLAVASASNSFVVRPVDAEHGSAATGGRVLGLTIPQLSVARAVTEGSWKPGGGARAVAGSLRRQAA